MSLDDLKWRDENELGACTASSSPADTANMRSNSKFVFFARMDSTSFKVPSSAPLSFASLSAVERILKTACAGGASTGVV